MNCNPYNIERVGHWPPVKGEYSYYICKNPDKTEDIEENIRHQIVSIANDTNKVLCHYSYSNVLPGENHVTCHGLITDLHTIIDRSQDRNNKYNWN